jgi:tryptophanyl-tRNA synthetase
MSKNKPTRVFSGIQPSGRLHIGNYLGAIRQWVARQDESDNFFCVVDMHAITERKDPETLRSAIRETAALYLAAGIDPEKSTVFIQSHVSAHAECSWILSCVTPVGWLERMTQFKVRSAERESVSSGLLCYPVLQAADILLYDTDEVPVGEDQKQHVELARDIARRFNHLYGETFVIPRPVIPEIGARILAFNDPARKMSKSEAQIRGHAVNLTDSADEIRYTIQHAVTDSGREIVFSDHPEKAGINNLLVVYELITQQSRPQIEAHFAGKGYGDFKKEVAEAVIDFLRPLQDRYNYLISDPSELDRLLAVGAARAGEAAGSKLDEGKYKIGFIPA